MANNAVKGAPANTSVSPFVHAHPLRHERVDPCAPCAAPQCGMQNAQERALGTGRDGARDRAELRRPAAARESGMGITWCSVAVLGIE